MATEFEKWVTLGKTLGYEGVELRQFVTQQQVEERNRRQEERQFEKERREAEERQKEADRAMELEIKKIQAEKEMRELLAEKEKREDEKERRESELAAAERKRESDKELEMMKLRSDQEIQLRRIESRTETADGSVSRSNISLGEDERPSMRNIIKLPIFDDDKDDLDAYLSRFERTCVMYGVDQANWSVQLARFLKGKALEVYQRIPEDSLRDYQYLKRALLKRFQLSEMGYRKRFKQSQLETGETPEQYVARLRRYLSKWLECAGLESTFEGLEDLMLKDQFFSVCSKELRGYLKEKGQIPLKEILSFAENYLEAHQEIREKSRNGGQKAKHEQQMSGSKFKNADKISGDVRSGNEEKKKSGCYICEGPHRMRDCPNARKSDSSRPSVKCYTCGGNHKASQCSQKKGGYHKAGAMKTQQDVVAAEDANSRLSEAGNKSNETDGHRGGIHSCGGHIDGDVMLNCGCKLPVVASAFSKAGLWQSHPRITNAPPTKIGKLNDQKVEVMRDTGCSTVVIRQDLVKKEDMTGRKEACVLIDGVVKYYPTAIVDLDTPFYKGKAKALCMERPLHDVIIGNIAGARMPTEEDFTVNSANEVTELRVMDETEIRASQTTKSPQASDVSQLLDVGQATAHEDVEGRNPVALGFAKGNQHEGAAVKTRAMIKAEGKPTKPLKVVQSPIDAVSVDTMRQLQKADDSLAKCWQAAENPNQSQGKVTFAIRNELLYRKYKPDNNQPERLQLMVPQKLREQVLTTAHDGLLSGHSSHKKTLERVTSHFYWPGICDQVKRYCWSCDRCQRNVSKGTVTRAPLGKLPLIGTPFEVISVDIVGPFNPASERGHRFILTVIDMASRYPDAIALKDIHTTTVAEALIEIYSRVGVARRVHSDRGSQFTSEMMAEVNRLLSIRATTTTPYHAMGNGIIENFNKSLKNALKKMAMERVKDWDRYLVPLLFAMRDVPQDSTGISAFELLYGRTVRGPTAILKELWTKEVEEPEPRSTYQFVIDLREKIEETCKLAQEELAKAQSRNQKYYNRQAKPKDLKVGDLALLLLPTDHNKLLLHWRGPFNDVGKVGDVDYKIEMPTGKVKTFHANMLKKYYVRDASMFNACGSDDVVPNEAAAVACVINEECGPAEESDGTDNLFRESNTLPLYNTKQTETVQDIVVNPDLSEGRKIQIRQLITEFADIFTDIPKITNLIEHRIQLTRQEPVRCKMYPVPYKMQETIDKELKDMLSMQIIEKSEAAYSSPLVIVKKSDGTNRVCVNFKNLNAITVFDPEPMMSADDIFPKLAGSQFYSKFDFSKGYWAIPMAEDSKDYTSFATANGLHRFRVMAFGLVNAGSTYNRMMRKLLEQSKNLESYLDDVLGHNVDWEGHVKTLRDFFERVRKANLALRPSKCHIGFQRIEFLGHTLTGDTIEPKYSSVVKILEMDRSSTKRQVRSFLGMVGFYRRFIPDCATLMSPLSDLTAKRCRNEVQWGEQQERAFVKLKQLLSQHPILKLPDLNRKFVLQTDASDRKIGAVLVQSYDGVNHPIAYASRKLLSREQNYTVGERECLAVVWAVQKFSRFLIGVQFTIESDHRPLECLNSSNITNSRIMRWNLCLQAYSFNVRYVKGCDNVVADCLSRM
jgi:transposase InsO family protein